VFAPWRLLYAGAGMFAALITLRQRSVSDARRLA
jgi:hypothetical protein